MDVPALPAWWPAPLTDAMADTSAGEAVGSTGTARYLIKGLLELVHDPVKLEEATALLLSRLSYDAPLWHIARAARSAQPSAELQRILAELDVSVPRSVSAATQWVLDHGGSAVVAPGSSVVAQVTERLGTRARTGNPVVGLAGADAIGTREILNAKGTYEIAQRLPTLIVTTSLKLVPDPVFHLLGAQAWERVPLSALAGVVIDGEIMDPEEAGRLAAALVS